MPKHELTDEVAAVEIHSDLIWGSSLIDAITKLKKNPNGFSVRQTGLTGLYWSGLSSITFKTAG